MVKRGNFTGTYPVDKSVEQIGWDLMGYFGNRKTQLYIVL
jgi:hypothetical protein